MLPRETSRCLLQLARDLPRQAISFCHAVIIRGKVVFALHALLIICEPIFRVDSSPPLKNRLCWHAHICMMTFSPFHAYEMGSIYINKGCHAAACVTVASILSNQRQNRWAFTSSVTGIPILWVDNRHYKHLLPSCTVWCITEGLDTKQKLHSNLACNSVLCDTRLHICMILCACMILYVHMIIHVNMILLPTKYWTKL